MVGENLHFGFMEVAFEQWTEQGTAPSRLQRISHRYRGTIFKAAACVLTECRKILLLESFLNLGGNTDFIFALN